MVPTRRDDESSSGVRSGSARDPFPWGTLLVGLLLGVAGAGLIAAVVLAPLAIAHRQDLPLERSYGNVAVSLAARLNGGGATNPLAGNPRAVRAGLDAYTGSCAVCHGADGKGKGAFGQATYPPATDLTTHDAKEKSDAELFWIIKNGLSFTGMPGFGDQYTDNDIWSMVSYVRALQSDQATPIVVPTPTTAQLAAADPHGDAVQKGAAIYFAQGCQTCHGAVGNAPAEMALRGGGREASFAVRRGRRGMPAYGPDQISDAELADLSAYMNTFAGRFGGSEGGFGQGNEGGRASPGQGSEGGGGEGGGD
jgi:mono/diheme cytochrome c family protein